MPSLGVLAHRLSWLVVAGIIPMAVLLLSVATPALAALWILASFALVLGLLLVYLNFP